MIKVNNIPVNYNRFPDGTLNIKGNPSLVDTDIIITWNYEDDSELMAVACLADYYRPLNHSLRLFMPYVPNARMDRVKYKNDIFTLGTFCKLIGSIGFDAIIICDPHSSATYAAMGGNVMIDNVEDFTDSVLVDIFKKENGNDPIVFFPDEGSYKRYSDSFYNVSVGFAVKNRDFKTGEIKDLTILGLAEDEIKGKPIIIRDDICSYGGTFYHTAKKLKELGAGNIYLAVTHCEDNIFNGKFGEEKVSLLKTGLIKCVYTTNSIYREDKVSNSEPYQNIYVYNLDTEKRRIFTWNTI